MMTNQINFTWNNITIIKWEFKYNIPIKLWSPNVPIDSNIVSSLGFLTPVSVLVSRSGWFRNGFRQSGSLLPRMLLIHFDLFVGSSAAFLLALPLGREFPPRTMSNPIYCLFHIYLKSILLFRSRSTEPRSHAWFSVDVLSDSWRWREDSWVFRLG